VQPAQIIGSCLAWIRAQPSALWRAEAKFKGVECAPNVKFIGRPVLSRAPESKMIFAEGVTFNNALRSNPLGCFQPSVLRTMAPGSRLELQKDVGVSATIIVAGSSIVIGEGTIVGAGAMIIDNDFHEPLGEWGWKSECHANARPIRIGRGVFIGARAIILKGVTIGDRAVIGAGAVIAKDVPGNAIAVGNPAIIKMRVSQAVSPQA
jgi:acetyltransferase-like isoleucine patch superfamily enzyme